MNSHFIHQKDKSARKSIVIADECGDTIWDEVLGQEVKACDMKEISTNASLLPNSIKTAQESA